MTKQDIKDTIITVALMGGLAYMTAWALTERNAEIIRISMGG